MIKVCGRHGYREQGSDLSDLQCPGCQREEDEENRVNPFEEMETL
jgi:hypothetical protein